MIICLKDILEKVPLKVRRQKAKFSIYKNQAFIDNVKSTSNATKILLQN